MAGYTTFEELRQAVLDHVGELPTDTGGDYYAAAGRELVRAAHELQNRHTFLWLRKTPPGALVTVAPYLTGTLALTNGNASVTFSPAPTPSLAGRKVLVGGWPEFYRITDHTGGAAAAILDVAWQGPTHGAATFVVYQDEYALATDLRHVVRMMASEDGREIAQKSEEWLAEHYPEPRVAAWPPSYFARITDQRIRFSEYPNQARRIEYSYTHLTEDIDTGPLLIPRNHRFCLVDGAEYFIHLMRVDARADAAGIRFGRGIEVAIEDDNRKRAVLAGPRPTGAGPY